MALIVKRVQIDVRCPWCLTVAEDSTHVLFDCSFGRSVWASLGVNEVSSGGYSGSAFEIFRQIATVCDRDKLALVVTVCWNLWNRRNRWVWDKVNVSAFGVTTTTLNMLQEWKRSRVERTSMEVNVDAAVFTETDCVGIGSVISDENGGFLRARTQKIRALFQPREAEAIALKKALSWVKEVGYQRCVFETDAKTVVDAYKSGEGNTYFHLIISGCIDIGKHYDEVLVEFVHRSANGVVHALARASHSVLDVQECGFVLLQTLFLMYYLWI
ncbi:uncharacterized protein LOC141719404 [Apium graveolens]|uniref:uncharacterized protein LOC141719404 n=1 Tax=Apium graveolens TaxID=4045 RepID=UPI003D796858